MRVVAVIITAVALHGCDESKEFFDSVNSEPGLTLIIGSRSGSFVSDSLKVSDPNNIFFKEVTLVYSDENDNVEALNISSTTGDVFIIQEDTILIEDFVVVASKASDSVKLEILTFTAGIKQLRFELIDSFNLTTVSEVELLVFENMIPVVVETHTVDRTNQIITFDLSGSYDQDENFGGTLIEYELNFNGETLTRSIPGFTVSYTEGVEVYTYSVRVRDNNGEYSETVVKRINITG